MRSADQANARAELAARREARDLAAYLRGHLSSPTTLARVESAATTGIFTDGSIEVDLYVGWLSEGARVPLDATIAERLRLAQCAEFVQHDAVATRTQLDELLGALSARQLDALPVLVAAAWQAHRAGEQERCATLLRQLDQHVDELLPRATADPHFAAAAAATALLHAARGSAPSSHLAALLAALPQALAHTTFTRLAEHGIDAAGLRAEHGRIGTRRALLNTVAHTLQPLPTQATQIPLGDNLLLWFPHDPSGRGSVAVVDRAWLTAEALSAARATPHPPGRGTIAFAPTPDGEELVPGFAWITPLPQPEPAWFARPQAIVGAGMVLVAVFAASAFVMLRAARREALALRTRADFLTGVTHELKTPVAAIRLVADVLLDDDVEPARQRQYFAMLSAETARLSALVDNVLDLGQMERGERAYDLRPGDLADLVREVAAASTPLLVHAGMQLELHEGPATAAATFDAGALRQALLAVVENARKYAAVGRRLVVTTARAGDTFTIALRDFGPGVPTNEHDAIFERFQRGKAHRAGTIPGIGLGLHLARSITTRHGGTLRCQPIADGPGARFLFTLPLQATP